ncbi:uncharacterized protein [Hemitrygon akajei]|uniref:uncharacterized protein n=1 Tax=Hemitrygon akajei TaxID=2704970 RepID=UPI003BF9BB68
MWHLCISSQIGVERSGEQEGLAIGILLCLSEEGEEDLTVAEDQAPLSVEKKPTAAPGSVPTRLSRRGGGEAALLRRDPQPVATAPQRGGDDAAAALRGDHCEGRGGRIMARRTPTPLRGPRHNFISNPEAMRLASHVSTRRCSTVNSASSNTGPSLPTIKDTFKRQCLKKAASIIKDPHHPGYVHFSLLPSRRTYRSLKMLTQHFKTASSPLPSHFSTGNEHMNTTSRVCVGLSMMDNSLFTDIFSTTNSK